MSFSAFVAGRWIWRSVSIQEFCRRCRRAGSILSEITIQSDIWSEWLLRHRTGGDSEYQRRLEGRVREFVERALDNASIKPGESVVDVGTGTGVLALRALERNGGNLRVIQIDVSPCLLQMAETAARSLGYSSKCQFLKCSAEKLAGIADASQDAVVSRASIAYVNNKLAAFREMYRVLRPGGRVSLAEPIRQPEAFEASVLRQHLSNDSGIADRFLALLHRWKSAQYPDSDAGRAAMPLVNFSETDLITFARQAGFMPVQLRYHVDVAPAFSNSWEGFISRSPYPGAPSLRDLFTSRFSDEERELFERQLRPTVESGATYEIDRVAYLVGYKPR